MIGLQIDKSTGLPQFRRSVWTEVEGTIGALASAVVIDSLPLADFDNMKYVMTFIGATQDHIRFLEMTVQQRVGGLFEVVSGKKGTMNIQISTQVNGSSFELLATNPENFSVDYVLTVLTV